MAIAGVGLVAGAGDAHVGRVADRRQVAGRRRHDLVDRGGDGELLGEAGEGVGVTHRVGRAVDAADGAGDERAERRQGHLVGVPERLLVVPDEADDAERLPVRGDQGHGGGGAQPAGADVGEQVGVLALVRVEVVDGDDLGAAHGLGGGQVRVERHEPAADGRAQQVAVDERDADLVRRRDVRQVDRPAG